MPKISVVIPCYNSFHLMSRCLSSLVNQTFKDFEVIIIDDCSKDDSYINICEYSKKSPLNIIVLLNEKNVGPGQSRNIAISKAEGDWITFCDCDDWYDNDYLEVMLNKAYETEAQIVMCDYRKIFDSGKFEKSGYLASFDSVCTKNDYIALAKQSFWLLLVKKDLFNNLEIPPLYNGEDLAVVPVLLKRADKISIVNQALYNYYIRNESASNAPTRIAIQNFLLAYDFIKKNFLDAYPVELEFIGIKAIMYGATLNAFKAGNDIKTIKKITCDFSKAYPQWIKNKYIKTLGSAKNVYLKCMWHKLFIIAQIYVKLHYIYTTR